MRWKNFSGETQRFSPGVGVRFGSRLNRLSGLIAVKFRRDTKQIDRRRRQRNFSNHFRTRNPAPLSHHIRYFDLRPPDRKSQNGIAGMIPCRDYTLVISIAVAVNNGGFFVRNGNHAVGMEAFQQKCQKRVGRQPHFRRNRFRIRLNRRIEIVADSEGPFLLVFPVGKIVNIKWLNDGDMFPQKNQNLLNHMIQLEHISR